tara:strand:+ start:2314 stop:2433 length:120 start_codon:yes stop_codon:yes gene_type:complete
MKWVMIGAIAMMLSVVILAVTAKAVETHFQSAVEEFIYE